MKTRNQTVVSNLQQSESTWEGEWEKFDKFLIRVGGI